MPFVGIGVGIGRQRFGGGFDADYQAVLDYATTQGYSLPSASQQILQNQLVVDLKDGGIWSKLDTFGLFATDGSSDFALIDWKRLSLYTPYNNPTFITNVGFQGNGTNSYINSNYRPSVNGVNYLLNNASFGYYCDTIDTNPDGSEGIFSSYVYAYIRYTTKRIYSHTAGFTAIYSTFTAGSDQFVSLNRSSSTAVGLYNNGVLAQGFTTGEATVYPADPFYVFRSYNSYSNAKVSMVYAGGDLTAQNPAFNTAWRNYYSSISS